MSNPLQPTSLYVFDMDETLIAHDLSVLWHHFLVDDLKLADASFLKADEQMMSDYYQGQWILIATSSSVCPSKTSQHQRDRRLGRPICQKVATKYIYPDAIALITQLKQQDKACMIISATVTFLVRALAKHLAVEFSEGVDLQVKNGFYTGLISGVPSYQSGKVIRLKQWIEQQSGKYQATHFYSDSINDLPLLLEVPNPVTINACPKLKREAEQRNWTQLSWSL
ncbi:phosphoserine phosphatase [Vibrio astriarenae]|nr:phosphoserine phosphatase [Vibrio sp. C7]